MNDDEIIGFLIGVSFTVIVAALVAIKVWLL